MDFEFGLRYEVGFGVGFEARSLRSYIRVTFTVKGVGGATSLSLLLRGRDV